MGTKNKVGRPRKDEIVIHTTIKNEMLKDLSLGFSIATACKHNGISTTLFQEWRKEDEEFAVGVYNAQQNINRFVCGKLIENVRKGDQRAIEFFMKTRINDFMEKTQQTIELNNKVSIFDELDREETNNPE